MVADAPADAGLPAARQRPSPPSAGSYAQDDWAVGIPLTNAGDLKMVSAWRDLGFVTHNPHATPDNGVPAYSEVDRAHGSECALRRRGPRRRAGRARRRPCRCCARGHTAAIVEASGYDADRIGEALAPPARGVLEHLGVWDAFVAAGDGGVVRHARELGRRRRRAPTRSC